MADDNKGNERKMRATCDQRLAALRLEERKVHAMRRQKRTHGLIKIGGTLVAQAGQSASKQGWLHDLWLKTEPRDREAIEIAAEPLDVTKPPERAAPEQQRSEASTPNLTSSYDAKMSETLTNDKMAYPTA